MRSSDPENTTTSFVIRKDDLKLLKTVAYVRALEEGGKPSVSGVLAEVIDRCRDELKKEAAKMSGD